MATTTYRHKAKQPFSRTVIQPALPIVPIASRKYNAKSTQSTTPVRPSTPAPQDSQSAELEDSQNDQAVQKNDEDSAPSTQDLVNSTGVEGRTEEVPTVEDGFETSKPITQDHTQQSVHAPYPDKQAGGPVELGEGERRAELPTDRPAHTEPTQENVQNIEFQLYETSKVQEWADEVNDGSNQSTWSSTKDVRSEPQVNGIASSSSHDELPQPVVSDGARDESSQTSAPEATVNGSPEDLVKPVADFPQDDAITSSYEQTTLPTITDHLLNLATTKLWADWVITVHVPGLQPFYTYAHSLVLVRSMRLEALMRHASSSGTTNNTINLYPPREVLPQALEAALRFLYSDNIVSEDYPFPKVTTEARDARVNALNYILSYWVAAIEFGLAPVAARALQLLGGFFGWDVAELIMKEADELKTGLTQIGGELAGAHHDYLSLVSNLKKTVLRFLSTHISPQTFKIEAAASPSVMRSRFALLEDSRVKHNPALASMVFGSMPSSTDLSPSSPQSEILPVVASIEDRAASNILLNIDFADLEYFGAHLSQAKAAGAAQVLGSIVNERESRRLKIISNRAIPNKQRIANSAVWHEAGYRETFEDRSLRRERVGFLLPTKSK